MQLTLNEQLVLGNPLQEDGVGPAPRPLRGRSPALFQPLILSLCLFFTGGLQAQESSPDELDKLKDLSIEELATVKVETVYGASQHEQKVTEAPSSISLVTADDIKKQGYRTLADILNSVNGFFVSDDRNYGYIGLRGFNRPGDYGGRVLILVDGQRLNEPLFDSAFNMTDFILDVDLIQRVEVIRGPGSSLYGDNAFFAVINVVTRRGADVGGVETSGAYGSLDTYQGRLTYGYRWKNGIDLLLSGSLYESAGEERIFFPEFNQPTNNNGVAENIDRDRFHSFLGTISWQDFTLQGAYVSRNKQVPTASFGNIFNDPRYHTVDSRSYVNLAFDHNFENQCELKAKVYYDHYDFEATYPLVRGPLNKDADRADWWGIDALFSAPLFDQHRFTAGLEFRDDFRLDLRNFDPNPPVDYLNTSRSDIRFAVFGQDEFAILTNLILNAGIRYDHFSTFGDTVNPRVALIYSPWNQSAFKLLYGTAFRAPNANELYNINHTVQKANPNLLPEEVASYELVYEQYLGRSIRLSASGFYNRIDELIGEVTDPNDGLLYFGNQDSVEAWGSSLEIEGTWKNGWQTRAGYTFTRTEDQVTGRRLSNSPEHLAKFGLVAPLYRDKLFAGIELHYSGPVDTLAGRNPARLSDWWTADVTLFSRELIRGLELSATVDNVFDNHYGYVASEEFVQTVIPQVGRTFRLKLTYKF